MPTQLVDTFAAMGSVVTPLDQPSNYKDSQARLDRQKQHELHQKSTTLYVSSHSNHLSFLPHILFSVSFRLAISVSTQRRSKSMTCSQSVPIPKMVAV